MYGVEDKGRKPFVSKWFHESNPTTLEPSQVTYAYTLNRHLLSNCIYVNTRFNSAELVT
jgi:hypothetical protein